MLSFHLKGDGGSVVNDSAGCSGQSSAVGVRCELFGSVTSSEVLASSVHETPEEPNFNGSPGSTGSAPL